MGGVKESLKMFTESLLKDPCVKGGKDFLENWRPFSKKHVIDFGKEDVFQQLRSLQAVSNLFDKEWDPNWGIYLLTHDGPTKRFEVFRTMGGHKRDIKSFSNLEEALLYKITLVIDEVGSSLESLKRM